MSEIEQRIKEIFADLLNKESAEITPDTEIDSLGADSLDRIEILMHAEEEFDIELEEALMDGCETFGQFAEYVTKVVEGRE